MCYPDPECPCEMNNSLFEPGIASISEYNKEIYYKFKERSKEGQYAPLEIIEDEIQVIFINLGLYCESNR